MFELLEDVVYMNDLEAFEAIFANGGNVNLQNKYGWTPLHIANERGGTAAMLVQKFGRTSMMGMF